MNAASPLPHPLLPVPDRCEPRETGFSSSCGTAGCRARGRRPWFARSDPSPPSWGAPCIGNGAGWRDNAEDGNRRDKTTALRFQPENPHFMIEFGKFQNFTVYDPELSDKIMYE